MKGLFMTGAAVAITVVSANPSNWGQEWTLEDLTQKSGSELNALFQEWKGHFEHVYSNALDEAHRFGIWAENMEKIAKVNSEGLSYKLRMNDFGDMTDQEFHDAYNCMTRKAGTKPIRESEEVILGGEQLPTSVDWTTKGVVTPVKNQGQCGSCWAFSATGSMECEYAIAHGTLTSLSEQQLVDCSGAYGNYGCSGGWYYTAWEYAESVGGLCTEAAYPYTATNGMCAASTCGMKYNDPMGYKETTPDSDTALATSSTAGCVSVAIEADQTSFQYYSSGVLTGACGTNIDHAVLVVGYGTESGQQYWKVKNSWGTSWGMQGYVYICRECGDNGARGECGINMYPYMVSE